MTKLFKQTTKQENGLPQFNEVLKRVWAAPPMPKTKAKEKQKKKPAEAG